MCLIKSENNSTVAQEDKTVYVNQINFVSPDLYFITFKKHDAITCDKMLCYYKNNKCIGHVWLKVFWLVDSQRKGQWEPKTKCCVAGTRGIPANQTQIGKWWLMLGAVAHGSPLGTTRIEQGEL